MEIIFRCILSSITNLLFTEKKAIYLQKEEHKNSKENTLCCCKLMLIGTKGQVLYWETVYFCIENI